MCIKRNSFLLKDKRRDQILRLKKSILDILSILNSTNNENNKRSFRFTKE